MRPLFLSFLWIYGAELMYFLLHITEAIITYMQDITDLNITEGQNWISDWLCHKKVRSTSEFPQSLGVSAYRSEVLTPSLAPLCWRKGPYALETLYLSRGRCPCCRKWGRQLYASCLGNVVSSSTQYSWKVIGQLCELLPPASHSRKLQPFDSFRWYWGHFKQFYPQVCYFSFLYHLNLQYALGVKRVIVTKVNWVILVHNIISAESVNEIINNNNLKIYLISPY